MDNLQIQRLLSNIEEENGRYILDPETVSITIAVKYFTTLPKYH